ncbi:MAG: sigma-70 family RNA polymerase sigma factor [Acidobacteria bacterium ACB1]|nr:ECF RNA polymerase sigma-E factor [Pyrinomonadaceae bacterium]MCE7963003.1 sigma-70 family RNA polymerase sigma factor [Acidobacteria bacterium ACB1]RIJ91571.1 MAG: RNA polymerase subunit sigma-24 [Acidobacteriota bacterium]
MSGMFFSKATTFGDEELVRAISTTVPEGRHTENGFVDKLKAGDAAAFDTLVERFSGSIFAVALRISADREEAEDLTQETFLRAFRSIGGFRGDASLKTWLIRIAINQSRNRSRWWRRRRRDRTVSLDEQISDSSVHIGDTIADITAGPEEDTLKRERETALLRALSTLKPIYREAIVLADIEGLTYAECAAALDINMGTLKSRIARAREELRSRLKDF